MTSIATHVRIFDLEPDDDLVVKRTAAAGEIAEIFKKSRQVRDILQTANDLAKAIEHKGTFSKKLGDEVEGAISKFAEAFVAQENGLQMVTCAMLGALQSLDLNVATSSATYSQDVFAVGLWSALSFQKQRSEPRLEALRAELLAKAQAVVLNKASGSRTRVPVPDIEFPAPKEVDAASIEKSLNDGAKATVDALRANAAVDREELDLLWWVLSDHSGLLGRRLSTEKNLASAAVASGLEAGQLLRRMPGEAHRHLVLRNVVGDSSLSLPDLIKVVEGDRLALAAPFAQNSTAAECPAVFPLITALRTGTAPDANSKQKRSVEDWAERALLESAILQVTGQLPSVTL
jgi:hypothetical protein